MTSELPADQTMRDMALSSVTYHLIGAVPAALRAVVLGVDGTRGWLRFIIDGTTSDALEELLTDVADNSIGGLPNIRYHQSIELLPEPGIINITDHEEFVFRRWEPGSYPLVATAEPLGAAKYPPPTTPELTAVLNALVNGTLQRYEAAVWARYWTTTVDRPAWYSVDHWTILSEIAAAPEWKPDARSDSADKYLYSDIHFQSAIRRL